MPNDLGQQRGPHGSRRVLIEREAEVATLQHLLEQARSGSGSVAFVDAPPGRGKTRLLDEARRIALDQPMRVLSARGSESERAFPFAIAIQLFEALWTMAPEPERHALAAGPARAAADLLSGRAAEESIHGDGQSFRVIHGLFVLCVNLLALERDKASDGDGRLASPLSSRALALLVDDVHWSDGPSLRFLAYLSQRVRAIPLAIVASARGGVRSADDTALAALRGGSATTLLRPQPLSADGVAAVIAEEFGAPPDPAFCAACARATSGNPFLLMEVLDQVRGAGHAPDEDIGELLAELPPESVLDFVASRLAVLSEDARRLARAISILGDRVSLRQAARMAAMDLDATSRAADALAAAHFLTPGLPLGFVHPLVRAAVRNSIPPVDRAQAHRRAAEILNEEGAAKELVAAHLMAAPPDHDPRAIDILRGAARKALRKGAPRQAVQMLERAIAEQPAEHIYPDLLAELAEAEVAARMPNAVKRLGDAISVIGESPRRSRLALAQGRALMDSGRHREAAEVLNASRPAPGSDGAELIDEFDAAYLAAANAVPELADEAAARAEMVRSRIDGRLTAGQRESLAQMALRAAMRGDPRVDVVALVTQAWDGGTALSAGGAWERCAMPITSALLFVDELERDLEICEAAMEHAANAAPSGSLSFAAAAALRAWPRYYRGYVAEAAIDAETALDAQFDRWEGYTRSAYAAVACGQIQRGQLDEAETALSILDHPSVDETPAAAVLLQARAVLRLADLRPEEALQDALQAGRRLQTLLGATSPGVLPWRSTAALAHLALGETERAWDLADEELELARAGGITRVVIRALRVQGLCVRGQRGIDLLTEAVEMGDAHPRRLEHLQALVDLGAALRRANRRAAAREPLNRALELAREGGLTVIAERARTELQATGTRARRAMLSGVDALTPSQRRVAELAAQGLTTRSIAETLFITPKTVEFHLRQIYQKLAVSSRAELTAVVESADSG